MSVGSFKFLHLSTHSVQSRTRALADVTAVLSTTFPKVDVSLQDAAVRTQITVIWSRRQASKVATPAAFSKSSVKRRRRADERRSLLFRRQTCVQGDALALACDTLAAIFLRSLSAGEPHAARSVRVLSRQLSFHVKGLLFLGWRCRSVISPFAF